MQSIKDRLETLVLKKNWTWEKLADAVGLSVSMLMQVKAAKRNLSPKALRRLEVCESECGISSPPAPLDVGDQLRRIMESFTEDELLQKAVNALEEKEHPATERALQAKPFVDELARRVNPPNPRFRIVTQGKVSSTEPSPSTKVLRKGVASVVKPGAK